MIAGAARLATGLAVALLGGDRLIVLRRRSVVVSQAQGRAVSSLSVLESAPIGATSLRLGGEAFDGVLAAGCRLTIGSDAYTLATSARLASGGASVSVTPGLLVAATAGEPAQVVEPSAEVTVPALRRDVPAVETESGVTVSGIVYSVAAASLPFEVDSTWSVVDIDGTRRVSRAEAIYAGGALVRWDLVCGAAA